MFWQSAGNGGAQANIFCGGGVASAHMTQIVSVTAPPPDSEHGHDEPPPPSETSYGRTIGANGWNAGGQFDSKPGASIPR